MKLLLAALAAVAVVAYLATRRQPVPATHWREDDDGLPPFDPRPASYVWVGDQGVATGGNVPPPDYPWRVLARGAG